jgi:hypothetical protein
MIHSFVLKRQPKSFNRWKIHSSIGQEYLTSLRSALAQFNPTFAKKTGELYGIAYYFHAKGTGTDADNISKPIWDCLTDHLFDDDKQVKIRIAGCFDLSKKDFDILDVSGVPGHVVAELVDSAANEEHTVYIECGPLQDNMYKFNL